MFEYNYLAMRLDQEKTVYEKFRAVLNRMLQPSSAVLEIENTHDASFVRIRLEHSGKITDATLAFYFEDFVRDSLQACYHFDQPAFQDGHLSEEIAFRSRDDLCCHTCGAKDPKTPIGLYILDMQPLLCIAEDLADVKCYPHCLDCSIRQAEQAWAYINKKAAQQNARADAASPNPSV